MPNVRDALTFGKRPLLVSLRYLQTLLLQSFLKIAILESFVQQAISAERNQPNQTGDRRTNRVRRQEQCDIHEHKERDRNPIKHLPSGHDETVCRKSLL